MTSLFFKHAARFTLAGALCLVAQVAQCGPGAHGPNGEHLDATVASAAAVTSAPTLEAQSELFEVVGRLGDGELSIFIDRFETNEPVLGATVELESGALKAQARFHDDEGDYVVNDPALLKQLSTPGAHALVITVLAGEDSDLLDGEWRVPLPDDGHGDGHAHASSSVWYAWSGGGLALLGLLAAWWWRRRALRRIEATSMTQEQAS